MHHFLKGSLQVHWTISSQVALLIVLIMPLCGAVLSYLTVCFSDFSFSNSNSSFLSRNLSGWIATLAAVGSFFLCLYVSFDVINLKHIVDVKLWTWINLNPSYSSLSSESIGADFCFKIDALSAVMGLVVTGVGSLIHLYAIGYMALDLSCPRFFAYLNLFLFSMLTLIFADNMLLLFVGWEGVGLCSYLLIGFWFNSMDNSIAGQKAFVVNRIGDAGLILGICALIIVFGTCEFDSLKQLMPVVVGKYPFMIEVIAFLLLLGAIGKSAQVPLHIWLPDAMAGPTPVSALIHAATMVTAGIYLITRLSFLFESAPAVMIIVLFLGTITAFLGATIALVQTDIKKMLAYSTVSQLGYMFMGLGVGAFSYSIYHVVTHAFFKACLFMGAGSVIKACHHNQDMRLFGGLRKRMPVTFIAFLFASLALAGFPMTSGYYSKDSILWAVMNAKLSMYNLSVTNVIDLPFLCWIFGVFTAFLTGLYITKAVVVTFLGEHKSHLYLEHSEPKESPFTMVCPLLLLGVCSLCFSFLFGEYLLSILSAWTGKGLSSLSHAGSGQYISENVHGSIVSFFAIAGVLISVIFHGPYFLRIKNLFYLLNASYLIRFIHAFLLNKWWVDEVLNFIVVRPLKLIANCFYLFLDRLVVDRSIGGIGLLVQASATVISKMHNGQVSLYGVIMLACGFSLTIFLLLGN